MDLLEFYQSLDAAKIEEMIREKYQEDLYLEFKTVSQPHLSTRDKENLARALSGFANSDGGIVIWGVDARRDKENGVDCAREAKPIADLAKFYSDLNSYTGQFVSPIVEGADHRKIEQDGSSGFAATYVPASISGPHMAKAGLNRYFKRSGDSFYPLEHYDLADMFGRRPQPKLEFFAKPYEDNRKVGVIVGLRNAGRAIARFPYLAVRADKPYVVSGYGLDGNGNPGLPRLMCEIGNSFADGTFGGGLDRVVHPGIDLPITKVEIEYDLEDCSSAPDLTIHYRICCEGLQLIEGTEKIDGSTLTQKTATND